MVKQVLKSGLDFGRFKLPYAGSSRMKKLENLLAEYETAIDYTSYEED